MYTNFEKNSPRIREGRQVGTSILRWDRCGNVTVFKITRWSCWKQSARDVSEVWMDAGRSEGHVRYWIEFDEMRRLHAITPNASP